MRLIRSHELSSHSSALRRKPDTNHVPASMFCFFVLLFVLPRNFVEFGPHERGGITRTPSYLSIGAQMIGRTWTYQIRYPCVLPISLTYSSRTSYGCCFLSRTLPSQLLWGRHISKKCVCTLQHQTALVIINNTSRLSREATDPTARTWIR